MATRGGMIPTTSPGGSSAKFVATRWTVVLAAASSDADSSVKERALAELAQQYWFPLYAYLRRQGQSPQTAEDLTQDFFAHLIEKSAFAQVARAKGRFRSFLLASLQNYLLNAVDKAQAQKRGGRTRFIALDACAAEERLSLQPVDDMTPERLFEQRWAWGVLDQVMQRLRDHYAAQGQVELFAALKGALERRPTPGEYASVAQDLNMSEAAVAVAAHRLRRRYRNLLRDEIAQTVASPELIDEEINYLLGCL